ncbi:MAG: tripartite tricarboxylate transporter substrate binding protein [Proteobacteria bacterium]|nr:tripartite tricarboxylate transporter substrate binding protein [Burkholderiales bacterium]
MSTSSLTTSANNSRDARMLSSAALSAAVPAIAFIAACATLPAAHAQAPGAYPQKPIRMIVPVSPGGNSDVLLRIVMPKMHESLGQQLVLDFRGGAGGTIGGDIAARSAPDGYTLLFTAASHVINPALIKKLPYDPLKDFTAISLVADIPTALVVHPSLPVKSVKDLIALAKKRPGELNYSTSGRGTVGHLAAELLASSAGLKLEHIPYKGAGPAIVGLVGGQVEMQFASIPAIIEHVRARRLRMLAQTGDKRSSAAAEVPTMRESGLDTFVVSSGFGILGPAALPRPIVDRVFRAVRFSLDDPPTRKLLIEQGADPVGLGPDEYEAYNRTEIARWQRVAREANLQPD